MDTKISLYLFVIISCFLETSISVDPRVFGGEKLNPRKHKHLVMLRIYKQGENSRCSGSIIDSNWILSAAHCVFPKPATITVFFQFKNGNRIQIAEMEKTFIHPDYKDFRRTKYPDSAANDVALIKTNKKITLDSNIQPISLAYFPIFNKSLGIIAGFGGSEDGAPRTGKVRLYYCGEKTGVLCSKGSVRVANGDSGGPMVVNSHLTGVVSATCKHVHKNTNCVSLYANVIENMKWINSITRSN